MGRVRAFLSAGLAGLTTLLPVAVCPACVGLLRNIPAGRGQKCERESKMVNSNGKQVEGQGDACGPNGGVPQL